jgi:hypothetical protein
MSSVWLSCSRAKCARSWVYKLVVRGRSFPGPGWWCMIVRKSNPCDRCSPLPFIISTGGAQGEYKRVTVTGSWFVSSYVIVRLGVSAPSCDILLGRPPRGWIELFLSGRSAFFLSSLGLL